MINGDEDGTVETCVTVWKRFADGRETVTTTTHVKDSPRDDSSMSEKWEPGSTQLEEQTKKGKSGKNGWFWN